jgi:hypothetical protein
MPRRSGLIGASLAWFELASLAGELALASWTTVAARSAMMARAAGNPVALADPEFARMASEKIAVALEMAPLWVAEWERTQRLWLRFAEAQSGAAALALFAGAMRTGSTVLGPAHRRAAANARRLGRRR